MIGAGGAEETGDGGRCKDGEDDGDDEDDQ